MAKSSARNAQEGPEVPDSERVKGWEAEPGSARTALHTPLHPRSEFHLVCSPLDKEETTNVRRWIFYLLQYRFTPKIGGTESSKKKSGRGTLAEMSRKLLSSLQLNSPEKEEKAKPLYWLHQ